MCRNGQERTRNDIRCAPALAADMSNVKDGCIHPFVTERRTRAPFAPSSPSWKDVSRFAASVRPEQPAPAGSTEGLRTSYLVLRIPHFPFRLRPPAPSIRNPDPLSSLVGECDKPPQIGGT